MNDECLLVEHQERNSTLRSYTRSHFFFLPNASRLTLRFGRWIGRKSSSLARFWLILVDNGVPGGVTDIIRAVGGGCNVSVHVSSLPSPRPLDTTDTEYVSASQSWPLRAKMLASFEVALSVG